MQVSIQKKTSSLQIDDYNLCYKTTCVSLVLFSDSTGGNKITNNTANNQCQEVSDREAPEVTFPERFPDKVMKCTWDSSREFRVFVSCVRHTCISWTRNEVTAFPLHLQLLFMYKFCRLLESVREKKKKKKSRWCRKKSEKTRKGPT